MCEHGTSDLMRHCHIAHSSQDLGRDGTMKEIECPSAAASTKKKTARDP